MNRDERQAVIITDLVRAVIVKIEVLNNPVALIKELNLLSLDETEKTLVNAIIAFIKEEQE